MSNTETTNCLPANISIGDKYGPAMEIQDQQAANEYFERCVEHCMRFGTFREEAERVERSNLGYFAGYYSHEIRERVERLFSCAHPAFGAIKERGPPTTEAALLAGMTTGLRLRDAKP